MASPNLIAANTILGKTTGLILANTTTQIVLNNPSGSGKTFLCLNAVRELQKKDYMVIYIDTEGAIDSSDYIKFGVDLTKLKYLRMGLISEVKFFVHDLENHYLKYNLCCYFSLVYNLF